MSRADNGRNPEQIGGKPDDCTASGDGGSPVQELVCRWRPFPEPELTLLDGVSLAGSKSVFAAWQDTNRLAVARRPVRPLQRLRRSRPAGSAVARCRPLAEQAGRTSSRSCQHPSPSRAPRISAAPALSAPDHASAVIADIRQCIASNLQRERASREAWRGRNGYRAFA